MVFVGFSDPYQVAQALLLVCGQIRRLRGRRRVLLLVLLGSAA
jgi:hypothetical protein